MNQINNEQKTAAIKTLAIIGFVFMIIFSVWLAVQIVRILPTAFSSLASIADSVNSNRPTSALEIESEKRVINSNQSFNLAWKELKRAGFYTFTYECTEGVSVDIRFTDGSIEHVDCEEGLVFNNKVTSVDVFVASEKQRFIDVAYTLFFTEEGAEESLYERTGKITVVNALIPAGIVAGTDSNEPEENDDVVEPVVVVAPSAPKPTTPAPTPAPKPEVITKTISYIPESDKNGYTDVRTRVYAVGTQEGGVFVADKSIDNDDRAAIQIEVKNFGTKTSKEWDFIIELPNGTEYKLNNETGLKPNERAIVTVGFEASDLEGTEHFDGKITLNGDKTTSDNSFKGSMTFVN